MSIQVPGFIFLGNYTPILLLKVHNFLQYFSYSFAVSIINGGNQSNGRKPFLTYLYDELSPDCIINKRDTYVYRKTFVEL